MQLNVAAAQLLARFLPEPPKQHQPSEQPWGGAAGEPPWVARLLGWFSAVMADGAALPTSTDVLAGDAGVAPGGRGGSNGSRRSSRAGGGGSLPSEVYKAALEGALRTLPTVPAPRRAQLLAAAAALWARTPVRSPARLHVLAFWRRLLADPVAAFYQPCAAGDGLALLRPEDAVGWLQALPRFLYELGPASPPATESGLRLLLDAARYAPPGSPLVAALAALQPQMAPLLATLVQQQAGGIARVHLGPLAKLPPSLQVGGRERAAVRRMAATVHVRLLVTRRPRTHVTTFLPSLHHRSWL